MALETTSSSIVNRMMRAARLEVPLYEEVEADLTATNQALLVVVLVAVASGIGAAIGASLGGASGGRSRGPSGLRPADRADRLGRVVVRRVLRWHAVLWWHGHLRRAAPNAWLRRIAQRAADLELHPVVGGILSLVVGIWTLVTSFIATRQALDIDNTKTFFTILIGAVALFIVIAIITLLYGAVAVFVIARGIRAPSRASLAHRLQLRLAWRPLSKSLSPRTTPKSAPSFSMSSPASDTPPAAPPTVLRPSTCTTRVAPTSSSATG